MISVLKKRNKDEPDGRHVKQDLGDSVEWFLLLISGFVVFWRQINDRRQCEKNPNQIC